MYIWGKCTNISYISKKEHNSEPGVHTANTSIATRESSCLIMTTLHPLVHYDTPRPALQSKLDWWNRTTMVRHPREWRYY